MLGKEHRTFPWEQSYSKPKLPLTYWNCTFANLPMLSSVLKIIYKEMWLIQTSWFCNIFHRRQFVPNPTTSYNKGILSVHLGRTVDAVCPDCSKAFSAVFHNLLGLVWLDGWSARWVGSWPTGRMQRVVINVSYSRLEVWMISHGSLPGPHCSTSS